MPAKTVEQRAAYDANRERPEEIKLRLTDAEAAAIRRSALAENKTLAQYVVGLQERRGPKPVMDLSRAGEIEAVRRSLAACPGGVRDLAARVGQLNGRLAEFFNTGNARVEAHKTELNEMRRELRETITAIMPTLSEMQVAVAEPIGEATRILKSIAVVGNEADISF